MSLIQGNVPPGPWTAPSAGVYAADGLLVCQLGDREVTAAYRKRGDGAGSMNADTAQLIAAAWSMREALHRIACQSWSNDQEADECMDFSRKEARAALALTNRSLSPSERGETFEVPR